MRSKDFHHVLIIGGTGMLYGIVSYYLNRNNFVTLIARNERRLQKLKSYAKDPNNVQVLSLNYIHTETSIHQVEQSLSNSAPVDAAILWIHNTGEDFKTELTRLLIKMNSRVKIYELMGSTDLRLISPLNHPGNSNFRKIILGCIKENNRTRWLTDEEIRSGTLNAIAEDKPIHVVGELP